MNMNASRSAILLAGMVFAWLPAAGQMHPVTQASVDSTGVIHIQTTDGKSLLVPKEHGAAGAADVRIAPDRRTVGWLATYSNPDADRAWEVLPGTLILWRDGAIIHKFQSDQVFRAWRFWQGSSQVAYNTGGLHGPAPNYELHDIATGRLLQQFIYDDAADPKKLPDWVKALQPQPCSPSKTRVLERAKPGDPCLTLQ